MTSRPVPIDLRIWAARVGPRVRSPEERAALDGYLRGEIFAMLEADYDAWAARWPGGVQQHVLDAWRQARIEAWLRWEHRLIGVDPALYA